MFEKAGCMLPAFFVKTSIFGALGFHGVNDLSGSGWVWNLPTIFAVNPLNA